MPPGDLGALEVVRYMRASSLPAQSGLKYYVLSAMAASLLRANDTPFQQRKRVDAFPVQVPRVEALPDYDFCNDGNFGLTGFDDDAFSWQDMHPSFQYCGAPRS